MKIVIDIQDDIYKRALVYKDVQLASNSANDLAELITAVANGTPLPKGHGRVIDADKTIKTLKSLGNRDYRREKGTIQEAIKMLSFDEYTPTIIEAEESEG